MPAGLPAPVSDSAVAPDVLQRAEPATYVMPEGRTSPMVRLVAALVPVFEYAKLTVMAAADGEGPEVTLRLLVTATAEFDTVVVSVLMATVAAVSVALTMMVPVWPRVAPAGTTPATTNRNCAPAASGPVEVSATALSGTPSPLASE